MLLLENQTAEDINAVEPLFFRIYLEEDKKNLEALLTQKPHIKIHDEIGTQLDDLIKSKHPKRKLCKSTAFGRITPGLKDWFTYLTKQSISRFEQIETFTRSHARSAIFLANKR
jgi:hypothetical protein